MLMVYLALVHVVGCFDVQVEGNVAFEVRVVDYQDGKQKWFRQEGDSANALVFRMMQLRNNITVAPELECVYQYPEQAQMDLMLSHMMNELTKVFVRANDFIGGEKTRRLQTRLDDTRFHIVYKKQKQFFEKIYSNMTREYREFYNSTTERVERTDRDPCQHQNEIKQLWRTLLEHSLKTLKKATERCVKEYLREQKVDPKANVAMRLEHFLAKELRKIKSSQLKMLCDTYQLCFHDLLK